MVLSRSARLLVAAVVALIAWLLDGHTSSLVVLAKGGKTSTPTVTPTSPGASAAAQRPLTTANVAARSGGGISPEFLAGSVSQDVGIPGAGLSVIGDIQRSLTGTTGPANPPGPPPGVDPAMWQVIQAMLSGADGVGGGPSASGDAGPGGQGVGGVGVSADTG